MRFLRVRFHRKRAIWLRSIMQVFFFGLIAFISVNHTLTESGHGLTFISSANLHAVCPFGGVETLYKFITQGTFVQKIRESSFVLMIIVFSLSALVGPAFCGWVCPLGTAQEWVGKLGRKIFKTKRYNHFIPDRFDKVLRYTRYGMLAWVLYITINSGKLLFQNYDPYFALFSFWTGEVTTSAFIILGITLFLSLFIERPWCKYACPYGAVLGLTNLFRVFQIRRVAATCRNDGACDIKCPMNIRVSENSVIRDHQCITCLECTSEAICPIKDTVVLAAGAIK